MVYGAGVLPYHVDRNGNTWFLLGQEKNHKWADFGGKRDSGETSRMTAIRECWEESRDILGNQHLISNRLERPVGHGYHMYFMELKSFDGKKGELSREKRFLQNNYKDPHRMEKRQIAWVKSKDLFKAIENHQPLRVHGKCEKVRGAFARTILKNATELKARFP